MNVKIDGTIIEPEIDLLMDKPVDKLEKLISDVICSNDNNKSVGHEKLNRDNGMMLEN